MTKDEQINISISVCTDIKNILCELHNISGIDNELASDIAMNAMVNVLGMYFSSCLKDEDDFARILDIFVFHVKRCFLVYWQDRHVEASNDG